MITLILTLPLYSAAVYGDFRITSITGNDIAKKTDTVGYRKSSNDNTRALLVSDSPDVRYEGNPNTRLDCQPKNSSFECFFIDDTVIMNSKAEYRFYMLNAALNQIGEKITGALYIDDKGPVFNNFNVYYTNNNITADFTIKDAGSTADASIGCAGVKTIRFYDDSDELIYNGTFPNGTCAPITGKFTYPRPLSDREHRFYAIAEDRLGNINSSVPKVLFVDVNAPLVSEPALVKDGEKLQYISTKQIPGVIVSLKVSDHNLSSVKGDLSKIVDSALSASYKQIPFTCKEFGESSYQCNSTAFTLKMPTTGTAKINISTVDMQGNNRSQEFDLTLTFDNKKPVTSISTNNCDEEKEKCYIKKPKDIILVNLEKQGAGFASKNVFIKASTLVNDAPIKADKCLKIENTEVWQCSFNITASASAIEGREHEVVLTAQSMDDVGNEVTPLIGKVTLDSTKPTLLYGPIFLKDDSVTTYLQASDLLEIKLWVNESTSGIKSAYANLKEAITGVEWVKGRCDEDLTKGANGYLCTFRPRDQLKNMYIPNAKVSFNITDFAGNSNNKLNGSFRIYSSSNNTVEFWNAEVRSIDPKSLDIRTSQYIPGKLSVWADVELSTNEDVNLLNVALDGGKCNAVAGQEAYLGPSKIFPPAMSELTGNPHALITLELSKTAPLPETEDYLRFNCSIVITSSKGNSVYPSEKHPIEISIQLKDLGLDLPSNYAGRINAFKEELKDRAWIDKLNEALNTMRKICTTARRIITVWKFISMAISTGGSLLKAVQYTFGVGVFAQTTETGVSKALEEFYQSYFYWICSFTDCSLLQKLNMWDSYREFIKWYVISLSANSLDTMIDAYKAPSIKNEAASKGIFDGEKVPVTKNENPASGENPADILGGDAWEASKKSFIVSALLFCIPGVIYNIEKARQIDCMYVDCAEHMTATGFNPYTCEVMRANAYCNFVYGSIFHAIPFSGLGEYFGNFIKLFTSNPIVAAGMVFTLVCMPFIPQQELGIKTACDAFKTFRNIIGFISGIMAEFDSWGGKGQSPDYCARVLDD